MLDYFLLNRSMFFSKRLFFEYLMKTKIFFNSFYPCLKTES